MRKVDGYIRVSRVRGREGDSFISPSEQREKIEAYARAKGFEISKWHEDLDLSGGTLERPGLTDALARCRAGETGGIIAAKLDRLTRSLQDLARLIDSSKAENWTLVAVDFDLDVKTPNGRLVADVVGAVAEWQRERMTEDWKASRRRAVESGVHIASRTPTGYRTRKDRRLEPDPRVARVIRELFRRRAAGDGWGELARFLDTKNVKGPYANKGWTAGAVTKIVRNRVYLGEARSGPYVNTDAHAAIVTAAEWEAAQWVGNASAPRSTDGALLSGLVRCAGCRYRMKPDTMRDRDGSSLRIYRCRGHHAAGHCDATATIMGRMLEPWVEQRFLAALEPDGPLAQAALDTHALDEARRAVEGAEHELVTYRDESRIVQILGNDSFVEGLEKRKAAVDEARERLQRIREQSALAEALLPTTSGNLLDAWPSLTIPERRRLLTAAIDSVVIRAVRGRGSNHTVADRALILWRGTAPTDLPRRGLRVDLTPFPWPNDRPADVGMAAA